jgi:uncharacterized repeat protein (TIGR01451 family)
MRYTLSEGDQAFTVPVLVDEVYVKVWGAGGGGSRAGTGIGAPGGSGGYVEGILSVTPGEQFVVVVGEGGGADNGAPLNCAAAYGFGGACPPLRPGRSSHVDGGGGGGLSGLFTDAAPVTATDFDRAVFVAGGGGAGEGSNDCGASSAAGGAGGNSFSGAMPTMQGIHGALVSAAGGNDPTGGGGGYRGGDGTTRLHLAGGDCIEHTGNGGSNFIAAGVTAAVDSPGNESTPPGADIDPKDPPNTSALQYLASADVNVAGVGVGQALAATATLPRIGGPGLVVLQWALPIIEISKTADSEEGLEPEETVTYTVILSNIGDETATDVTISDPLPDGIASGTWACAASGATCPDTSGDMPLNQTIASMPIGSTVTYTIEATATDTPPASVVNTASVSGPFYCEGLVEPPCTASVANPAVPVVSVTKTTTTPQVQAGDEVTFIIVVSNTSSVSAAGTVVTDSLPAALQDIEWTCEDDGGAACPAMEGNGDLDETIATFPAGSQLTWTITATASGPPQTIANTVSVSPLEGICNDGSAPPCMDEATIEVQPPPAPPADPTPTQTPDPDDDDDFNPTPTLTPTSTGTPTPTTTPSPTSTPDPDAAVGSIVPPTTGDGGLADAGAAPWSLSGALLLLSVGVIALARRARGAQA